MNYKMPPGRVRRRVLHTTLLLCVLLGATATWLAGRFDATTTIFLLTGTLVAGMVAWIRGYPGGV